jgi:hypothetical protein
VQLSIVPGLAQIPALELDRMTDDGGPLEVPVRTPIRQVMAGHRNRTKPSAAVHTGAATSAWFRQLGASHRTRNDLASCETYTRQGRDLERRMELRRHWPGIVAAMRTLSHCYNEGAGLEVLTMADDANADSRTPLVEIAARGGQTLTITLVDAELCVRQNPGPVGSLDGGGRWIVLGASDEATAAYALQHWLTQL